MTTYKLVEENDLLKLVNEQNEIVPATNILQVNKDKRVFAFNGKMGAGKTTFIRQLCKEMGVDDVVNSPTFAIVNVYEDHNGEEIYHFDCYRLKTIQEALDFGAEEYLYSGKYCFIEWPDIIEPILPEDTLYINLFVNDDGSRTLEIKN